MIIDINKKSYNVLTNEFNKVIHNEYNNLIIRDGVASQERIISLLNELSKALNIDIGIFINPSHGAFMPINCSNIFKQVQIVNTLNDDENTVNIEANILLHKLTNILLVGSDFWTTFNNKNNNENNNERKYIIYTENADDINTDFIKQYSPIILTTLSPRLLELKSTDTTTDTSTDKSTDTYIYRNIYDLTNSNLYLYIPNELHSSFINTFHYFIKPDNVFDYDNLINLCIMVKNGGPQFEQMLIDNLPIIDKWTILDTGSTDDTINIINKVLVGKKHGNLYQEPFINFCESRNRLLDLAGTSCKYIIMLDDTYVVQGDLRSFLTEVRGDQYADSFTLYIKSDDTQYGSNRIIKSNSGLRYIHKIHEVITDKDNINIVIPESKVMINDRRFDYMEKRTQDRKQLDLKLLYEEVEENPNDPRAYYYLAQTYNLLEDYENAYKYFMKRCEFINSGFLQERVDAAFEAARVANFKLNKPWSECMSLYEQCYKIDESRPEALYFIGIHYYLENDYKKAFPYLKKAFEIGYPRHCQYSLKPTLSFHFCPKFLTKICYQLEEYELGENAARFFLQNNNSNAEDYSEILSWYNIFVKMNMYKGPKKIINTYNKPLLIFVADGGFNQWTGSNILTTGVGGSETYIIEMARWIQKSEHFQTIVFCNTPNGSEEIFENTIYKPLTSYYKFINTTYVHTCIISRFSEYLPVTYKGFSENVYLVVHDLTPSGIVIPMEKKLKNIFCLTEWHVEYMTSIFPQLKSITVPFYYGIDNRFINRVIGGKAPTKNKFIYSSFPNRGLLQLLQMWPTIIENVPTSTLHIYSDVNNKWSNDVEPQKMQQIRDLLDNMTDSKYGIHYHGWVGKKELAEAWLTSDIWFYPCTFAETFCLTALEAASSKTFVVTNDLAALQNTVGNRGLIIKGDPTRDDWKEEALNQLFYYLVSDIDGKNDIKKNQLIDENFAWANTLTWESQAQKMLDTYILPNSIIEYKGMYNWTNDLPYGHKQYFLDVLQYFNQTYPKVLSKEKINVLEIGTYTGVSLINIINAIPNSVGIGVDMWSSYNENKLLENMDSLGVEKSFYKNISSFGLENRITGIKSDSTDALTKFLKDGTIFDFIYIDGSHLLLDCYSDLVLAWIILEKHGIIAIDDYLYKVESMLDSPFEAVNHFLKRYEGKYKLLHKGYRVFLQKI
jgi:predicted O-methyltransferase YrrM/tetratricopeptide (TPR) repeat protein